MDADLDTLATSGLGGLATDTAAEAEAVRAAYGDGLALVFGISAVASLVTLVAVLLIREVPLRTTVGPAPDPAGPDTTRSAADGTGTDRADAARTDADRTDAPRPVERPTVAAGVRHGPRTEARDRLLTVLLPRPQEALRALDDIEAAQRDLRATRDRLDDSLARLRAIGLDEHQLGKLVGTGR